MARSEEFAEEKKLLEFLDRIERNQSSYAALYVYVSKLKPKNRHPLFVKIIARLFDGLVGTAEGRMFVLENGDFVIVGKNITQALIDNGVGKLRQCLQDDPVLLSQDSNKFAKLYVFPDEFINLQLEIEQMVVEGSLGEPEPQKFALEAGQIDGVIEHLDNINITDLVKHQSILRIENHDEFKTLYQEFFVAVKDLSRQYDSSLDLVSNKWLFLYLTQTLDKKTMRSIESIKENLFPSLIGLNLNLSSVFSPEFAKLIDDLAKLQKYIVAEVQLADVFNNLNLYFDAKKFLQEHGGKILIDGMSLEMIKSLNVLRLQPDWIKLFWDPMMEFEMSNVDFARFAASFGSDNVILAKCKDAKAIRWGIRHGIRNFQGPYMDNLEIELIRKLCPEGNKCSADECLKRRRLISGDEKDKCLHKNYLEKILG